MHRTIIKAKELHQLINTENPPVIADCRFALAEPQKGHQDYLKDHIPGAYYAHLDNDLASSHQLGKTGRHPLPDMDDFRDLMRRFGVNNESQVVAYDGSGGSIAARLWGLLRYSGHEAVAILDGGYPAWVKAGYNATDVIPEEKSGNFEIEIQHQMIVDHEFMKENYSNSNYVILDSRAQDRYLGDDEPIDPIAGHIPNAVNYPYGDNLLSNSEMKSPEKLRERFRSLMSGIDPSNVIVYCGSGVTSILNQIAIEHAGLGLVRLYVGSWSEWITDPGAPVELGEEAD